jgi:hypothetical protein
VISPNIGADLAQPVASIYAEAELAILERIAGQLQLGMDADDWDTLQLARLQQVRAEVLAELSAANPQAAALLQQQLDAGYAAGQASAMSDVGQALDPIRAQTADRVHAVAALAKDTATALQSAQPGILRAVDDVYRQVVADTTAQVLTGNTTRREAAQEAVSRLFGQGLRGVETARGTMDLETYATMAVRTATARSAIAGHEGVMDEMGLDLVVIHPGPRACPICDRWARMILARKGPDGALTVTSLTDGKPMRVNVGGTLQQARSAGWGHPNCRCNLAAYMPGVTRPDEIQRPPHDEAGYRAQQQQRGIERAIRDAKRQEAVAMTPAAKAAARARVLQQQARMRDHLAQHPYLKRQGKREQLGSGLGPSAGSPGEAPTRPPRDPSKPLRRNAQPNLKPVEPELTPTDKAMRALGKATTHEHVAQALRDRYADSGIEIEGFDKPGRFPVEATRQYAATVIRLLDDYPALQQVGKIAVARLPGRQSKAARESSLAYVASYNKLNRSASINLNPDYKGAHDVLAGVKRMQDLDWSHGAASTLEEAVEYVTTHEVGHLVDLAGGNRARNVMRTKVVKDGRISGYAKTSSAEAMAEAFATMRTAPQIATPAERAIYDRLMNEMAKEQAREPAAPFVRTPAPGGSA